MHYDHHPDPFLNAIRLAESETEPKVKPSRITIQKTGELYYQPQISTPLYPEGKVFKPDIIHKLLALAFLSVIQVFLCLEYGKDKADLLSLIVVHLLLLLFTFFVVRELFFDRRYNFHILVNDIGITIDGRLFPWSHIYATAILTKYIKSGHRSLVIALEDQNTYECYSLHGFLSWHPLGFEYRLSRAIEYFKQRSTLRLT